MLSRSAVRFHRSRVFSRIVPDPMTSPFCPRIPETSFGCRRPRNWLSLAGLVIALVSSPGCIHRRVTVRTDPPGALVLLEGEEVGYTPYSFDFTYYGTREFTLVKDGYETVTVLQKVPKPWYQRFPLEFVTDNFSVVKINDRHDYTYRLRPQVIVPTQELLDRASGLRNEAQIPQ